MTPIPPVYPDREWYTKISTSKGLPKPRCPYASAERCPRFYQSLYLLGHAGSTEISEADDKRLQAYWEKSDLWPLTDEQRTSVTGGGDDRKSFHRFCPELTGERFGLYASDLLKYATVEDSEIAQEKLGAIGSESSKDYRWFWWHVKEEHYSDCALYSLLPYTPLPATPNATPDDELLEMKPSVGGFTLNLKVLFTRLAKWWLKKQKPT